MSSSSPTPTEEPLLPPLKKKSSTNRHVSLDLLRGLIIMIMAWDHVCHQFTSDRDAPSKAQAEAWEGPYRDYDNSWRKFIARAVSHICAPGFFFTMGISMILFTASRRELLNWSWCRIFFHHFVRGIILMLIDYLIDFPGFLPKIVDLWHHRDVTDNHNHRYEPGDEGKLLFQSLFGIFEVMTALGLTMIISQFFMPIFFYLQTKRKYLAEIFGFLLFLVVFIVEDVLIIMKQDEIDEISNPPKEFPHFNGITSNFQQLLIRTFFYPGTLFKSWEYLFYPVFPWIGITLLGMGFGMTFHRNQHFAHVLLRICSVFLLVSFVCIRSFGGILNYRGKQRGETTEASPLMEYLIQTKYPPDLAYSSITLSIVFILISFLNHAFFVSVEDVIEGGDEDEHDEEEANSDEKRDDKYLICFIKKTCCSNHHPLRPLLIFGRTPLFFYISHFWFIQFFEALFRIPDPPSGKFRLEIVLLVWIFVLFVMYILCSRYQVFKSNTHPGSLWRMF